jgi:hypothetical protein
MFKGNTKLELNTATLVVAIQEYLDKRTKDGCSPRVKSIAASSSSNNFASGHTFEVFLEEPEPPKQE